MPRNARKKRAEKKEKYVQNKLDVLAKRKEYYSKHQAEIKAKSKALYDACPEVKKAASQDSYSANPEPKKASKRANYAANPDKRKQASLDSYSAIPEVKKAASRDSYSANPEPKKAATRANYAANPDKQKQASRDSYSANPESKKAISRKQYSINPNAKRLASRILYAKSRAQKSKSCSEYYREHQSLLCSNRRNSYRLAEPKHRVKDLYVSVTQRNLILDNKARIEVVKVVRQRFPIVVKQNLVIRTASRLATSRLVNKALYFRKEHAGRLLKATREIKRLSIKGEKDFGDTIHTVSSEPYFYDSAYQQVQRHTAIPIEERGRSFVANGVSTLVNVEKTASPTQPKSEQHFLRWKCCSEFKPLTKAEVSAIIDLKDTFDKLMIKLRQDLDMCDSGCPNQHYTRVESRSFEHYSVECQGHTLVCSNDSGCSSKLRILRAASTHFPVLRTLQRNLYSALSSHRCIARLDKALSAGDFQALIWQSPRLMVLTVYSMIIVTAKHHDCDRQTNCAVAAFSDTPLEILQANLISTYQKELDETDPVHMCCSCEQLHKKRNVTKLSFSDTELGTDVWLRLKAFILKRNKTASKQVLFMCNYCKQSIKIDKMPPRCVLNGLETVEIKAPLAKLDRLSRQLIQRAKCYQTVVRLGTYTHKVAAYNSLKACKVTMFFLPLPFNNTVETVDEVIASKVLPEPELYIIINGKPTKNNVLWRDLVDVEDLKAAIEVLKKDNCQYKDLDDSTVDEAAKKVLEVANNTSSKMLDKATKRIPSKLTQSET